jgi:CubicO group peptidase (beta-lactamase class C family)
MKTCFVFLLAGCALLAAPPDKLGLDPQRLANIPVRMQEFVDRGVIPGAVTLVSRHGEIASLQAVGWQEIETRKPMRPDSIFQIMSMTKPITATAIMLLMEEGRLVLSDPVEKYLPDFHEQWVIDSSEGKVRTMHRAPRPITLRDLLTHTSGMNGAPPGGASKITVTLDRTLADVVTLDSQAPLLFDPGTKWSYSNPGMATLGRIVEVVSGQPYEKFVDDRILRPLGMKDTFFYPPEDKRSRIAMLYDHEGGHLVKAGPDTQGGDPWNYRKGARYPCPECGLFSTATDLFRFYQTILNHGTFNGVRLLSRPTVDLATSNHTADIQSSGAPAWGLGWSLVAGPLGSLQMISPGSYGHGGAFGTHGMVDPPKDMIRVFMVGLSGGNTDEARNAFLEMAGTALVE